LADDDEMPQDLSAESSGGGSVALQSLAGLRDKGTYTLLILVQDEREICVGSLQKRKFPRGFYAYTGSALGKGASGLPGRTGRHLKGVKKNRWHVDYLLSGANSVVTAIVTAYSDRKMECAVNRHLKDGLHAQLLIPRFGSSDCKENCVSHLLYLGSDKNYAERIAQLYLEKTDGVVQIIDLSKSSILEPASALC